MAATLDGTLSPARRHSRSSERILPVAAPSSAAPPRSCAEEDDDAGAGYYSSNSCITRAFTPLWLDASLSASPKVVFYCLYEFGAKVRARVRALKILTLLFRVPNLLSFVQLTVSTSLSRTLPYTR